jgi:hypothetical protein
MSRARRVAVLAAAAVSVVPLLSACGGSAATNAASAASSLASKAASVASSAAATNGGDSSSPTPDSSSPDATSSSPDATSGSPTSGTTVAASSDYCGAFKELQGASKQGGGAAAAAVFHQAAADMKKYAPAEIADSANAYADLVEAVATALDNGTPGATSQLATSLAAKPQMMSQVVGYVAKNCGGA